MAVRNVGKTIESIQTVSVGQAGGDWIDDTTAHTGDWAIIVALENTVFTLLTTSTIAVNSAAGAEAPTNLNGKALGKGLPLYGRFSAITLASGVVIAYRSGVAG